MNGVSCEIRFLRNTFLAKRVGIIYYAPTMGRYVCAYFPLIPCTSADEPHAYVRTAKPYVTGRY